MKRVIVFGATGTVGAYTALRLKEDGIEVIGTGSRFTDGGFFAANGIEYICMDITQAGQFLQKLPSSGIDAIVNLAGMLPARMQGYFPQAYIDINMSGMLNILEYAAKTGVSRLVYSQSISDVDYLMGTTVPVPEDSASSFPRDNDHSVYSITKNAAADLLRHYSAHFGFGHFILRFPNIYLYHPNPWYFVNGEKRIQGYRAMIYKAMKGEDLTVWGNPSRVRDMVYVKDCTKLISLCLSAENAPSGVYNAGTGIGTSLEEQIRGIAEVFSPKDHPSRVLYAPEKPDAPQYIFDISKGRKYLGYSPSYSYMDYLRDFRKEMEANRFEALWGPEIIPQ